MADKTLKMWFLHVKSQVAENLNDYRLFLPPLLCSLIISYTYFTRHFLVHLITFLSLVFGKKKGEERSNSGV